jgi:hypothetical protein
MPKSISAEHLGTVDQYYWDSFWSLAGIRALGAIAHELQKNDDSSLMEREARNLEDALQRAIKDGEKKFGRSVITAGPVRRFDEGAIGSICSVYPLRLNHEAIPHAEATVSAIHEAFVDEKGFFHPLIHSGYNPYLTLQLAHCFLEMGDVSTAWKIAQTIFRQASPTYNFPEAIHPKTGGGTMGDGHHGWAAAEVVLFLRDLLVKEGGPVLQLLVGAEQLCVDRTPLRVDNASTQFGTVSYALEFESDISCTFRFSHKFFPAHKPECLELAIPFALEKIIPVVPSHILSKQVRGQRTLFRLSPDVTTIFFQLR